MGQYYHVLETNPELVYQFYSDASTMVRIDGNARDTATAMLVRYFYFKCFLLFHIPVFFALYVVVWNIIALLEIDYLEYVLKIFSFSIIALLIWNMLLCSL